jgi:hypothetical protein
MTEIRINRDLTLEVPEPEFADPQIALKGYLLRDDGGNLLLISFASMRTADQEWPCWIPREFVDLRLRQRQRRPAWPVRSGSEIVKVAAAIYGGGTFVVPQWLANRLGLLTAARLRQLRRERDAEEAERRRRRQELERVTRDARRAAARQRQAAKPKKSTAAAPAAPPGLPGL